MELWSTTHHIRELLDEFVMEFLRTEAASAPVESSSALKAVASSGASATAFAASPWAPVYGELYGRTGGQAYAHHAGELLEKSSPQPTIAALRAFLKGKNDAKATWRAVHPYIVVLVEGGQAVREPHEPSASSLPLPPQLQPVEKTPTGASLPSTATSAQAAAFSTIVAAAAQCVARRIGGLVHSSMPGFLHEPDTATHQLHRPLQQQQQQKLLQQLEQDIAHRAEAQMMGSVSLAGGGDPGAAAAAAAQSTLGAACASTVAQRTPVVLVGELWPYTIADGLAVEGLLGSPVEVFVVSMDENDTVEECSAGNNGGASSLRGVPSSLSQLTHRRGSSAHAALLEYYAAKKKLTALTVPFGACSAVAQEALSHDAELGTTARAAAESLAEQIARHLD
ncbi:hypothetical protein, unknown function [Leishmania tarentolae]|uniref:Uncharacterized protein n=1 Tax=Leishmania tarentolae TaxID=5689 RepID=A0A640KGZ8_LEITA|nr:hypothetical protein, unknown function [Leishmania tarentolae]